jgi:glycine cleavage system H protein
VNAPSQIPSNAEAETMPTTRYTKDHEWIRVDGDVAVVGITSYAQSQLGDVVFVELPKVGARFAKGDEAAVVESVKAASEVYAPAGGEVVAVNDALEGAPASVNEDAEGAGWFLKLKLTDAGELDGLMNADQYKSYLETIE